MKSIFLSIGVLSTFVLVSKMCLADPNPPRPLIYFGSQLNPKETPDEFRARYGLRNKDLEIEKVEVNDAAAAADGPIIYSIRFKVLKPNTYYLTFENQDQFGFVFEMRKVRLMVEAPRAGVKETEQMLDISPENATWRKHYEGRFDARVGNAIRATWPWNPGGEGVPGGWFLSKIEDASAPTKDEKAAK